MKKKNSVAGAVVFIVIGIMLIIGGILIAMIDGDGKLNEESRKDLYIIASVDGKYGIARADGTMLANTIYSKISMGKDVIYLKDEQNSYLYNLKDGTTSELGGIETDIVFPKDKDGEYIDKYILKFGAEESSSIYRVVDIKGVKTLDKDFASIYEAYVNIGAKLIQNVVDIDKEVLGPDRSLVKTLNYLTEEGKYQYIVKSAIGQSSVYGIIDEDGNEIVPFIYETIEIQEGYNTAVVAKKNEKIFVIARSGKVIEIEPGFEADIKGEGYIVQKKGITANKLYNLEGQVVIDNIFNYPIQTITLNSKTTSYLFVNDEKTGKWTMYDLGNLENETKTYSNINLDYLNYKNPGEVSDSFIYIKDGFNYVVDLETFSEYKLGIATNIIAPLQPGYKIDNVQK